MAQENRSRVAVSEYFSSYYLLDTQAVIQWPNIEEVDLKRNNWLQHLMNMEMSLAAGIKHAAAV